MSQEPSDLDITTDSIAADNYNEFARLNEALLEVTNRYNEALETLVHIEAIKRVSDENWETRCDSLAAINADVEQRNEKVEALLVEIYNASSHALAHPELIADRMRELGLLEGDE